MDLVNLLVSVVSGAVGGNAAGAAMPDKSLGTLGNSIAGVLGGGLGGVVLQALGIVNSTGGTDIAAILSQVASGGVGGGIAMVVIALIKNAMSQRT